MSKKASSTRNTVLVINALSALEEFVASECPSDRRATTLWIKMTLGELGYGDTSLYKQSNWKEGEKKHVRA